MASMKKALLVGLLVAFGVALSVRADEAEQKPLTPEQKQQRADIIKKYDANKDGVLDKQEMKQLSKADKKTLARTGGVGTAKGKKEGEGEDAAKVEKKSKDKKADESAEAKPDKKRRKNK